MIMNKLFLSSLCLTALASCKPGGTGQQDHKPNILLLYVDDLGFGDIGINGARGVQTPNIDRLAENGLLLTDAHCSAATSTPSRYSLLTGSYAFRNNAAILPGDSPLIIDTAMTTLPDVLRAAGYKTGVIGKWHLGLGLGGTDWNGEICPGPKEIGFDYSFLLPATGDRVPCVFVENQRVLGLDPSDPIRVSYSDKLDGFPTGTENPELLKMKADLQHSNTIVNGVSRIGYMSGGRNALWTDENFPEVFNKKAIDFIRGCDGQPFFLYYAFHDIHVPRLPHPDFVGKSSMGPRGDAIAQVDWCVGELVGLLEKLGLSENTLVIFTSDNGPVLDDGYEDMAVEMVGDHNPSGPFRGGKYSAYEAGTRMPTVVYWPGVVEPGVSDALLSQVDLLASFASLVGQNLKPGAGPDSFNYLDAWLGKTQKGRDILLEEAFTMALRFGEWKYIDAFEGSTPEWLVNKDIETGLSGEDQLYNLSLDPAETVNLEASQIDKVKEMQNILEEIKKGHSRNTGIH